ncbi:FAD-dependent oxidoreductase [Methylonatrum kenyense]|uniref:FAD-dependent oxidoreductase n=1 Tax=Methylonatrum kenyense TaxID=455253 RepID=UPI0020BD9E5D|nr:FAD-dependent oxidoreductase [Methylonatrum kenyense]MCK8516811.1 FAD-dependent oxidoreductase [Methylonatrum kenyense]
MRSRTDALDKKFEVLILGGGIHGVALARTLAQSGVSVALVERGDFGGATTRNSLKIVHGGLRYVQHLDARRIRESVQAQRAWLAAAPHLVRPMRFTMPTIGWGVRSPLALAAGALAYRLLGGSSRQRSAAGAQMPDALMQGKRHFAEAFPEVKGDQVNGCMSWFDAQILDSGRLVTACVEDAAAAGAVTLNHVEAVCLRITGNRVSGGLVRDCITGEELEVRSKITVATLGAWGDGLAQRSGLPKVRGAGMTWTKNVNLVLKRRIVAGGAVALMSRQRSDGLFGRAPRLYFVTPWQDTSIVGTTHQAYRDEPDSVTVSREEVNSLLLDINSTLDGHHLRIEDVASLHMGLTPSERAGRSRAKRTMITDYRAQCGITGFIDVAPNKYTTAPTVSSRVAALVLGILGRENRQPAPFAQPMSATPEHASDPESPDSLASPNDGHDAWVRTIYGRRADGILAIQAMESGGDAQRRMFRARVIHGINEEGAIRLGDAIFRCSDLAERGRLSPDDLAWCLNWMKKHFGWTHDRSRQELGLVLYRLRKHMSGGPDMDWSSDLLTRMVDKRAGERARP